MDERIFTARLRKASVAVFLATGEESVARDLSKMLKGAADEIDSLRAELKTITSGMGSDMLGTVSLSREDMQSIAGNALAEEGAAG